MRILLYLKGREVSRRMKRALSVFDMLVVCAHKRGIIKVVRDV
jgi:hypothetical protein